MDEKSDIDRITGSTAERVESVFFPDRLLNIAKPRQTQSTTHHECLLKHHRPPKPNVPVQSALV